MYLFVISCIMRISAMCHEYFCSVSWVILQCVMSISTMCHQYFCNVSWVFFAICHEYFCNMSWVFLQYVMNISAMCHVYFPCYRLWMWSNQRSCYSTVPLSTNNPQQVIIQAIWRISIYVYILINSLVFEKETQLST